MLLELESSGQSDPCDAKISPCRERIADRRPRGPGRQSNSGKTALFNALTGGRQKVANYAGVTVERKEGVDRAVGAGVPSWTCRAPIPAARSPDEEITRDVVLGG